MSASRISILLSSSDETGAGSCSDRKMSMLEAVTYRVTPRAKALVDGSYQPKVLVAIYRGDTLVRDVALYARCDSCPLRVTAARLAEALALRIRAVLKDVHETDDVAAAAIQTLLRRVGLRTTPGSVAVRGAGVS